MATVRDGSRQALVVVDVQVGVMQDVWESARVIGNVATAVERARHAGVPVIWVQHSSDDMPRGSTQWQWVPELEPAADEARIDKAFSSSFEGTTLDAELARLGVSHIVLAGAATNRCIRATAYGALDRGYDLTLLGDAHGTGSMRISDGLTIDAWRIVEELNLAIGWLEYPGVSNGVAAAAEVRFGAAGGAG